MWLFLTLDQVTYQHQMETKVEMEEFGNIQMKLLSPMKMEHSIHPFLLVMKLRSDLVMELNFHLEQKLSLNQLITILQLQIQMMQLQLELVVMRRSLVEPLTLLNFLEDLQLLSHLTIQSERVILHKQMVHILSFWSWKMLLFRKLVLDIELGMKLSLNHLMVQLQ